MEIILKNIKRVWLTKDTVKIQLKNGKTAQELFPDYPRLKNAIDTQRKNFTTSEFGIYWPDIDEDLSFEGFFREKTTSEIGKIFSELPEINVTAFARKFGITQPLMADSISGKKKPGKLRKKKIEKSLHQLGESLKNLHL